MRRGLGLPCLALVLALSLTGSGTAIASDPVPSGSYVGNGASLVRIDANTGTVAGSVALEPHTKIVGPPSLDIGFSPSLIYVGCEEGVLYAVEASF